MNPCSVLICGAGSWGTALAIQLGRNNHSVTLWDKNIDVIHNINQQQQNSRYLPGIKLSPQISGITELHDELINTDNVVLAVPCGALADVTRALQVVQPKHICIATKGLQAEEPFFNHLLVTKIVQPESVAVLSGPSFAMEVARKQPTAVTIAASSTEKAQYFARLFGSTHFRTYIHDDPIGVQIGGSVKNVIAIAAGIAAGKQFGSNAHAALLTRGLREMIRLGIALGAKKDTFTGLSGIGDLTLTCGDDQSRNRRFGSALAKGDTIKQACEHIGQTVEGLDTACTLMQIASKYRVAMPITAQVTRIIAGECRTEEAISALLQRDTGMELY